MNMRTLFAMVDSTCVPAKLDTLPHCRAKKPATSPRAGQCVSVVALPRRWRLMSRGGRKFSLARARNHRRG